MKVFIFGAKGMLGRYVRSVLSEHYAVAPLMRKDFDLARLKHLDGFLSGLDMQKNDIAVNCAALLKDRIKEFGIEKTIRVNTLFPRALLAYCRGVGARLIHISSDYLFSGRRGKYNEKDFHDAVDDYGKTKSLGEPETAAVIRTSIIGEEVDQNRYLLEWVRSQKGEIRGFVDHWWNGVTCLQLANIIKQMIDTNLFWNGARHIFSPDTISKYQLVSIIKDVYEVRLRITPHNAGYCNRSLCTLYDVPYEIPPIYEQIVEMKSFSLPRSS